MDIHDIQPDINEELSYYARLITEELEDAENSDTAGELRHHLREAEGWTEALLENIREMRKRARNVK